MSCVKCGKGMQLMANVAAQKGHPRPSATFVCGACRLPHVSCENCRTTAVDGTIAGGKPPKEWSITRDYALCEECYDCLVDDGRITPEEDYYA